MGGPQDSRDFVDIFVNSQLVGRYFNTPRAYDYVVRRQIVGDKIDFRFEFSSQNTIDHLHMLVVPGSAFLVCDHSPITIPVDPRATYFRLQRDPNALPTEPISLLSLGLEPGDFVRLTRRGNFAFSNGDAVETGTGMLGIFSSSDVLESDGSLLMRVPGAIEAGTDFITPNTARGNTGEGFPTDIPEDFFISDEFLEIPVGATHLRVSANDLFFGDNADADGDFGIVVTPIPNPEEDSDGDGQSNLSEVIAGDRSLQWNVGVQGRKRTDHGRSDHSDLAWNRWQSLSGLGI